MTKKKFKVYYTYIDTDTSDVMAGEKTPEEIERALSNYPGDLRMRLNENDDIKVLEKEYSSNYIVVEITSSLTEQQLLNASETVLKSHLLLADELND